MQRVVLIVLTIIESSYQQSSRAALHSDQSPLKTETQVNRKRRLNSIWFSVMLVWLFAGIGVDAQSQSKETPRNVHDQTLTSTENPAVRLEFDKKFKFAGSQTFILYNVARAEQFFFVDADEHGAIKRLYWVQFEGYLPDNTHTYKYEVTKTVNIGGLDFIADAYARNYKVTIVRPDSDSGRARAFLETKGYHWASDDNLSQRLVHLVDDKKRAELMIIYREDLSGLKLTAADINPGGRAAAQWNDISKELLERALKGLKVTQLAWFRDSETCPLFFSTFCLNQSRNESK